MEYWWNRFLITISFTLIDGYLRLLISKGTIESRGNILKLNTSQIQTFQQVGFLEIPHRVIENDHLQQLRRSYDQVFEQRYQTAEQGWRNLSVTADGTAQQQNEMLQVSEMWQKSNAFRELLYHQPLLDIATSLIGPDVQLFHDQALYKPAKIGGPVPWHQDNGYWRCQPADLVSIWMALDDADTANGCMNVVPGSHLESQPNHSRAQEEGQELPALLSVEVDASQSVSVPLKAGHAMVHHCLTLHQTDPNRSNQDRRAMVIHYMPVGTRNGEGILLKDNLLLSGQHLPTDQPKDSK